MKSIFFIAVIFTFLASCSAEKKEALKLTSFKDKISYVLGADHARVITESGDKNFDKYDIGLMVTGFREALKNEKAFDKECQSALKKMFGKDGKDLNSSYLKEGSACIGKLSGTFFVNGWKIKKALDKIDLEKVALGFEHGLRKIDTIVPRSEQGSMIQNFISDLNKLNGNIMLADAQKIEGATVTESGIVIEKIQEGTGGSPKAGDDILAHYILMNAIGDTLQDSYKMVEMYQQALSPFSLLQVVPGWQEAFPLLKKGGKYRLYIPYHLAYGQQGMFNPQTNTYDIQPFESLKFFIEFLDFGTPGSLIKKEKK